MKAPREYQKNFYARRSEAGEKKVHIWLTPDAQIALDELMAITGLTKRAVIEKALKELRDRTTSA